VLSALATFLPANSAFANILLARKLAFFLVIQQESQRKVQSASFVLTRNLDHPVVLVQESFSWLAELPFL